MPELTHPDSKQRIKVTGDSVPMYLSQGWRVVESRTTTKKKTTTPKKGAGK